MQGGHEMTELVEFELVQFDAQGDTRWWVLPEWCEEAGKVVGFPFDTWDDAYIAMGAMRKGHYGTYQVQEVPGLLVEED